MVTAVILCGGTGTRMKSNQPKQYIEIEGKPILWYCLRIFKRHPLIDRIIIVAAPAWQDYIRNLIRNPKMEKFVCFANAGTSRQDSIYHGLLKAKEIGAKDDDIVIIHDAVRPCVSARILTDCIHMLDQADGAMPVLPVKDTVYKSSDGKHISALLNRDEIFAGQAPESFRFGKYLAIHEKMSEEELASVRGSCEIAFRAGMKIKMFEGEEGNYKITTPADLEKFRNQIKNENREGII